MVAFAVAIEALGDERAREQPVGDAHRQQPVAVDGLEPDRHLDRGGREHARQEEGRIVVRDDHTRPRRERREQPLARAGLGLDVGQVADPIPRKGGAVLRHALQHEGVQPVARVAIAAPQRLEHAERSIEFARQFRGALQREVRARPARRDHPVHDELAIAAERTVVGGPQAGGGNRGTQRGHPGVSWPR
jgi:hypothetical protein